MKNLLYAFTTVLVILTSCSKEDVSGGIKYKNEIITASIEQKSNSTRMSIDNGNNLSWTSGDIFTFFTISGNTYNYGYSSENNNFTPVENGTALPDDADVTMVSYPYRVDNTYTNKVLTVTLPNTLDFTEVENESKNPIQIPMWGTFNNSSVAFKHLAGILRVNLSNIPVGYNQITIEASKTIAGTFNADFSDENNDNVYLVHKEDGLAHDNIIVKFNPVTGENNNKTLYLPLPVGTYESIVLSLQEMDNSGNKLSEKILANWSDKTVQRAHIYTANATYQEASSIADANEILSSLNDNNKNIHVVIEDVEDTNTPSVSVPVVEGSTVVMDFSSEAANKELTISQENAGNIPEESVQNLIVNVDDTYESSMTINTPTATVELGAGNFTTITATTATNTLIVKSGVQIDNLTINGGNVVIEEGAEVTSITNNGSGIISTKVNTADELKAALTKGENIVLGNDIIGLTEIIKVQNPLVFDGNGYKITSTAQKAFEIYNNATFNNVTIECAQRCIDTRTAVNLSLDKVTLIADNTSAYGSPQPLTIGGSTHGTVVTINNSNISSKAGYAIITFVKTQLTATASTIGGYNALYAKPGSKESKFDFKNSTLYSSMGNNDVAGNSFAAIALRDNDITLTVDEESKITATGNYSYVLSIDSQFAGETGPFTGIDVTIKGTIKGKLVGSIYFSGNSIKFAESYKDALKEGGYFASEPANGLVIVTDRAFAKVSGELYNDLNAAISASNGNEVTLLRKISLSETLIITKSLSLDLNEYTISPADDFKYFDGDNEFYCMLLIDAKKSGDDIAVTIKNGTIDGGTDKVKTSFYAEGGYNFEGTPYGIKQKNLTLNVENLKVKNTRTDGNGAAMVIAGGSFNFDDETEIITSGTYGTIECSADGTLNVNGATITHGDSKPSPSVGFALGAAYGSTINVTAGKITSDRYCLYALPTGGTINVSGGTFNGDIMEHKNQGKTIEVNISGGTFSVNPIEYLVDGKTAVQSGSTWTVKDSE